jgi:hypothetical protein
MTVRNNSFASDRGDAERAHPVELPSSGWSPSSAARSAQGGEQ